MKRNLLLVASVLFGASAMAQFVESNAPAVGDAATLYIVDSLAPNYAAETGASATWDYSATLGYENETRDIQILDPTSTGNAASYPLSTKAQDIANFLLNYSTDDATGRVSQGFVFTEASLGEVVARFETDQAQLYTYPMDFGTAAIVDDYVGEVDYTFGVPQTAPMTGNLVAEVDGKGTLKLWGNDYTDVLRYKIMDTMHVTITGFGAMTMAREQYEYYDHSISNLPIFVHTRVQFGQTGGTPMSDISFVLSKDAPTEFVSVTKNELEKTAVYPNPATENLSIQLPSSIESANVEISDALGRIVYSAAVDASVKTVDVSNMNKGIYIVKISNGIHSTTKNVVIK